MPTIQATTLGGKIITQASWRTQSLGRISIGETVRVNIPFEDERLAKFLAKSAAQECVLEQEAEEGTSVTVGFMVEKFTHMLDASAERPDVESMAWLKPMNRTVEAVVQYLLDRENCDLKFLAAIGAKRKETEEGSTDA